MVKMATPAEEIKSLLDRLSYKQLEALRIIVESMIWPQEQLTPEEAEIVDEGFAEIERGEGMSWEEVKNELGL
nr:hypothetical protein [Moorella thermoacetica]